MDFQGIEPRRDEIFRNCPDRPWGHPAFYTKGTGSFQEVKRPGRGVNHPPPSNAEVEDNVELYLFSPCGRSSPLLE